MRVPLELEIALNAPIGPQRLADDTVVLDEDGNHSASSAQLVPTPCEISGRLIESDERDWYAISARRGEVLYLEGLGQRIQ